MTDHEARIKRLEDCLISMARQKDAQRKKMREQFELIDRLQAELRGITDDDREEA